MNNSYAKVILDSVGPNQKRIITVQARYWRAIHAEIMTHRDRARNAASSRAIPFLRFKKCTHEGASPRFCAICNKDGMVPVDNCTYSMILKDSFFPEFIGAEQKGMQSGSELMEPNRSNCLASIERMRDFCLKECKYLYEQGVHKSIINRYLEPWSYITVVMTATEWKNFFRLRVHPKAEKHFNKVASQIKAAIDSSMPQVLRSGEWHMPYLTKEDRDEVCDMSPENRLSLLRNYNPEIETNTINACLKRVSAAYSARLSYLNHEGHRDLKDSIRLFDSLIHPKFEQDRDDDVIHASPLEHVNRAVSDPRYRSGPMVGWHQMRKDYPNENVDG